MYRIQDARKRWEFMCGEESSLLFAMNKAGAKYIPVGCRAGGCGVCKVQILSGECHTKTMSRAKVTELDEACGVVLACRAYPRSDMVIDVAVKNEIKQ